MAQSILTTSGDSPVIERLMSTQLPIPRQQLFDEFPEQRSHIAELSQIGVIAHDQEMRYRIPQNIKNAIKADGWRNIVREKKSAYEKHVRSESKKRSF